MNTFAFDTLADDYDAAFTDTSVGRRLRDRVWNRLNIFEPGQLILELGCGTGEDAVWLAQRGVRVVATDASVKMIQIAKTKAREARCDDRIEFHPVPMENIATQFAGRRFDGVFSNFGAINCVQDLSQTIADAAMLVKDGGHLLWVVMGRHVPWEWLWYLFQGNGNKAFRRYKKDGVKWRGLRIFYPTPTEMTVALAPFFTVKRIQPLGWILPPSYAANWLNQWPRLFSAMSRLEQRARRSRLLASIADHYIIEAERV